jgi:hypothetical protein
MFDKKQTALIPSRKTVTNPATVRPAKNAFVQAGLKTSAQTLSGNGALKYTTTGDAFVDEFGTAGRFKAPRDYKDVDASMRKLWSENRVDAVKFAFYLRMVTRQVVFPDGTKTEETQRGQGLKHEGIYRVMWLAINQPKVFWNNVHLFISVGGWKDIITMLSYDLQYNGWKDRKLDWDKMGKLVVAGLENPKTTNLVRKYLPQIKANSYCKTLESQADNMIAKWICSLMFGGKPDANNASTYKKYRKLKSSGTAHQWQQAISQGQILNINFDTVHGRALALLVSGKFLKNNKLEDKYAKWISNKPVAKFTGYVHELAEMVKPGIKQYQIDTINAQFNQLVAVAMVGLVAQGIRPISAVDTSGSMDSPMYIGSGQVGKLRSIQIAFSSTLFFDEMILKGSPFKNSYLCFSSRTSLHQFSGTGFVERYNNIMSRRGGGGTNFESVFQFFADFKRNNPSVPESEIPNFVVCWSDGEFNRVSTGLKSNVDRGRQILQAAGYSKDFYTNFGLGFIELPNTFYSHKPTPKFETFGDVKNVFYFSGHDLSPLAFLFGVGKSKGLPTTASELFQAAMDQEVLNLLEV